MKKNILYILSSYNRFSGTPKKTFDLINHSENNSFLYVWTTKCSNEFKESFETITKQIFEGDYGRNFIKHIKKIINIIDEHQIETIQTQFFFGELLAGFVKQFRPKVKLIVTFEGSMSAGFVKRTIQKVIYKKADAFIYISKYVKTEKERVFPQLKTAKTAVIYNGTEQLKIYEDAESITAKGFTLLSVSSLIAIKNITILIDAMQLLLKNQQTDIHLFIVGDGAERKSLEQKVKFTNIEKNVHFLGRQKAIGNLLENVNALVHPCYIEGFGLSVVEAMMAEKPVIVANSGALPEVVTHKKTGLLVHPFKAEEWQKAILAIMNNQKEANEMAREAKLKAEKDFSIKNFAKNYNLFYQNL